ncbi:tRNA pseudouridine(55) synthase TruB [Lactococcus nasutitermitis]|uniref:tRNA pseudouridine synthase B n=1 Tax=Lactococcus nasutitermitis TaxID=1652957 RepID=A0ABV9JDR9_9LACT|nr:tRNA pseudouridine(55) synthase TruB [Lactococcus nasutitermitis]
MDENWNGILNVYKEAGWTSFDVVAKLRGILKTKKIGHGGTLDPQVTGVLPVAVGKATRLLEYMEATGKIYEGEVTLGFSTETEDAEGEVVALTPVLTKLSENEIDTVMTEFLGKIQQVPPMYSAVKIKGKRLYEYARAGQTIERPAREVTIREFVRTGPIIFDETVKTAKFPFRVACSKGTYVRTLAVDLAEKLGYAGHMSRLVRTAANGLAIDKSLSLADIEQARDENRLSDCFYPMELAVTELSKINLTEDEFLAAKVGKKFDEKFLTELSKISEPRFAAFYQEKLVAVYIKHPVEAGIWKPQKVFYNEQV